MICHASFHSSQKSLQFQYRPPGSIDLGQKDPIATGPCNSAVGNDETDRTSSKILMILRNERRSFKNISICVTKLPATPFLHRVRIPGEKKKPATPSVPDYIHPDGRSMLYSRAPMKRHKPRSPPPTRQLIGGRHSDGTLLPNPSRGRYVTSRIIVQRERNSDGQMVSSSSQYRQQPYQPRQGEGYEGRRRYLHNKAEDGTLKYARLRDLYNTVKFCYKEKAFPQDEFYFFSSLGLEHWQKKEFSKFKKLKGVV